MGAPWVDGLLPELGRDPARVLPHHWCTCVNNPPPKSALPPIWLSSLSLLLWTLTGNLKLYFLSFLFLQLSCY